MNSLRASPFGNRPRLASMFELFDTCRQSAIEVDRASTVVHLNRTAEDLIASRAGIAITHDNRLITTKKSETLWLGKFIASAAKAGCPSRSAMVTVPFNNRSLLISLVPLCLNCREKSAGTCDYHVVVLPVRPEQSISVPEGVIGRTWSLTKAETRVAQQILMGRSPDDIAADNNVSINTVRTQLRSIYRKSNTTGQTGFAAKVLSDCIFPLVFWRGNLLKPEDMEQS